MNKTFNFCRLSPKNSFWYHNGYRDFANDRTKRIYRV